MSLLLDVSAHEKVCRKFTITGRVTRAHVVGLCTKCGAVIEAHKRYAGEKQERMEAALDVAMPPVRATVN
jgi:hypothetical protein